VNPSRTLFILCLFATTLTRAEVTPDFSESAVISVHGRSNPYELDDAALDKNKTLGKLNAISYPVSATGILPPFRPFQNTMTKFFGAHGLDDALEWLGLHPFPDASESGVYSVPYPDGARPDYRMGLSLLSTSQGQGFTLSCATCHSANLFGKTVLGMTNRFPRANELFLLSRKALVDTSTPFTPFLFQLFTDSTVGEREMMTTVSDHIRAVGVREPQALGLDTSLAQVALSMAHRSLDSYATRSEEFEKNPRPETLSSTPADSKPAVWWNVKYKNRWLSDGSVVSGNPIFTNIIWNEIGRGADLKEIETWMAENPDKIRELTTAVFSSEAPRLADFFPPSRIDLLAAKRGEQSFLQNCAECHGTYQKAWSLPGASDLPFVQQLETVEVSYHAQTPVVDVGTDPFRYQGMASLAKDLNPLAVSMNNSIVIKEQKGYVPPPLVGIWARWPYFHNNSAPSLCAVLSSPQDRPVTYMAREASDPNKDFDFICNGYPTTHFGNKKFLYDTRKQGMSNSGHDMAYALSASEKADLIQFLQTL
jgi:mono/diheme cytochrome c family protein